MTLLGILTPITLRANLAAAPALIALCAIALGDGRLALAPARRPLCAVWWRGTGGELLQASIQLSS